MGALAIAVAGRQRRGGTARVALFSVIGALVAIPMVAGVQLIRREVVLPSQEAN